MTDMNRKYFSAFLALMFLLAVTYALAHINLGPFNTPVGLLIASGKAVLVILYFMHIRYESGLHRVAAGIGVFWLSILVVLVLADYISRGWLPLPSPWP